MLQADLIKINRMYAGEPNIELPYSVDDVRNILFASVKFNKSHTFKGFLPADTVSRLRTEGLDVRLTDDNHTVVSWGIR